MTTIVTFTTKDVIVMGGDSLGTLSRPMIDPAKIYSHFDKNGKLKKSDFNFWNDIYQQREDVPYSHMAHVDKLFKLHSNIGVLVSGLISIGDRTLKSIIQEVALEKSVVECEVAVKNLANEIQKHYKKHYPNSHTQPAIELLVAGWDNDKDKPQTYRIKFPDYTNSPESGLQSSEQYGISLGGQYREIARLIQGTDIENMVEIQKRHREILIYLSEEIQKLNPDIQLVLPPDMSKPFDRFDMFGPKEPDNPNSEKWRLSGLEVTWGDFSDQNAINCVYWLIDLMIKVQEFGNSMPTVGGEIHVAIIDKKKGFKFLSEDSYNLQGHRTPKTKEAPHATPKKSVFQLR